jgi:hypothetical protein
MCDACRRRQEACWGEEFWRGRVQESLRGTMRTNWEKRDVMRCSEGFGCSKKGSCSCYKLWKQCKLHSEV